VLNHVLQSPADRKTCKTDVAPHLPLVSMSVSVPARLLPTHLTSRPNGNIDPPTCLVLGLTLSRTTSAKASGPLRSRAPAPLRRDPWPRHRGRSAQPPPHLPKRPAGARQAAVRRCGKAPRGVMARRTYDCGRRRPRRQHVAGAAALFVPFVCAFAEVQTIESAAPSPSPQSKFSATGTTPGPNMRRKKHIS
jgi:hypothetical protein